MGIGWDVWLADLVVRHTHGKNGADLLVALALLAAVAALVRGVGRLYAAWTRVAAQNLRLRRANAALLDYAHGRRSRPPASAAGPATASSPPPLYRPEAA
jgi:hypothetical protein